MFRKVLNIALVSLLLTPILDAQGTIGSNWTHTWGGSGPDVGNAVAADSTGNTYVAGSTSSFGAGGQDVLLIKYDPNGNLLWAKTWGGPSTEFATAVALGTDGGIYVTGVTASFGAGWYDVFLLKFDSSGALLWQKTWGGNSYDAGHDISFDNAGNVLVAAESYSFVPSGDSAAAVLKFTPGGDLLWSRVWASGLPIVTGPVYDGGYSLDVDGNGNIFLSGITWDYNPSSTLHNSIFVVKFDSSGNFLWNRNWAGAGEDEAWGTKTVRADQAGSVYVAARTAPNPCAGYDWSTCKFDVLLLKLDTNGNYVSSRTWDSGTGYNTAESFTFDARGNLVITGVKDEFGASAAALLLQYDPNGNFLSSQSWSGAPGSIGSAVTLGPAGNIILAGSAINNVGSWQNAIGTSGTENGTLSTQASHVASPAVALGAPSGILTSPLSAVIDTGGGGSDVFLGSFNLGLSTPVLTVTANNASRSYGIANPAFTYTVSGFVNGDTQASATSGAPSLTTTATATSSPGIYPITVATGTLSAANYSFSFMAGTLTVAQAGSLVTLTSSDLTIPLNSTVTFSAIVAPATSGTPTGTVTFFDTATQSYFATAIVINGVATYTTSALAAGTHLITAQYGGDINFAGSTSAIWTETITQRICNDGWSSITGTCGPESATQKAIVARALALVGGSSGQSTICDKTKSGCWLTDAEPPPYPADGNLMRQALHAYFVWLSKNPQARPSLSSLQNSMASNLSNYTSANAKMMAVHMTEVGAPDTDPLNWTYDQVLDWIGIRKQCMEWAITTATQASPGTTVMRNYASPAFPISNRVRPGMGLYKTGVHAMLITDILWKNNLPAAYQVVEANYNTSLSFWSQDPTGQVPWLRTVDQRPTSIKNGKAQPISASSAVLLCPKCFIVNFEPAFQ